uniref:VAN3-binding protein n=1 Tax=Kalanchoe fedtschenkoi TaxID=63787 RepID=A0A7N0U1M1_KALFE
MEANQPGIAGGEVRLPESPRLPMEFLSRSWSASSLQVSKAVTSSLLHHRSKAPSTSPSIPDELANTAADSEDSNTNSGNASSSSSSFASSAASQLVLERIMSERILSCTEISPMTSGRPSHSSEPLNGGSPMLSPSRDFDDVVKSLRAGDNGGTQQAQIPACRGGTMSPGGGKTVGRWLKDRREKKKEETRAQNAQLHAAISVAGVAAAVAAMATAAAATGPGGNEKKGKLDMALASAATLVAAQCVEAAEAMGVERDQLASVVGSAVNVRCYDDILTLTAAAATALRCAATLKARVMKDIQNAVVVPMGKEMEIKQHNINSLSMSEVGEELALGESPISASDLEFFGTGQELLKRTRNGDLHWKIVSVYIHRSGEVMLKMKSKYVRGTITNKKKNVVLGVCKSIPSWPGRHLLEDGEQCRYFGLKTAVRGVVEFECRDQQEHDLWTEGVSRLLAIVAARKNRRKM